jgi:beta-glucosidase/6-phospho-beta-glucosidase/beta-galactosidase
VRVDYPSLQRTPKDSALWYRDVAAANAVDGDDAALRRHG